MEVIGGQETGPLSFYRVSQNTVDGASDGSFRVLDVSARRLHSFSPDGDLLWSIGREGRGPGEFSTPGPLSVDSIGWAFVYDWDKRAVSVFDTDGSFVRQEEHPYFPIGRSWPHFAQVGRVRYAWKREAFAGSDERSVSLVRLDSEGHEVATLVSESMPLSRTLRSVGCPMALTVPIAFAPVARWHVAHETVAINVVPEYQVQIFRPQEDLIVRRDIAAEPITEAEARAGYAERAVRGPLAGGCSYSADEMLEGLGYPRALQVVSSLSIDDEGRVLVSRAVAGGNVLDVLAPNGEYIGTAQGPFPTIIEHLGGGRVLFEIEADSLGIERLGLGQMRSY